MGLNCRYEIRVKGVLDGQWAAWFDGLQVSSDGEETVICGPVADQAALHGLLTRVRDLGLFLTSVRHVDPDRPPVADRPSAQETQGVLMCPITTQQFAAARPAATPIKNTDRARKESAK